MARGVGVVTWLPIDDDLFALLYRYASSGGDGCAVRVEVQVRITLPDGTALTLRPAKAPAPAPAAPSEPEPFDPAAHYDDRRDAAWPIFDDAVLAEGAAAGTPTAAMAEDLERTPEDVERRMVVLTDGLDAEAGRAIAAWLGAETEALA